MASWGVVIMLLITDNKNVESRARSVVKYVIKNIMSTALTGRRNTATYLHLVRELLYKIKWPSRRRLRIGIVCTYRHFVRALPIFCDWVDSKSVVLWESDWVNSESVGLWESDWQRFYIQIADTSQKAIQFALLFHLHKSWNFALCDEFLKLAEGEDIFICKKQSTLRYVSLCKKESTLC